MSEIWFLILGAALGCVLTLAAFRDTLVDGAYTYTVIADCEETLPRNQSCRITAEPVPMEGEG